MGDVNLIFIDQYGNHVPNKIDERIVRVPLERLKKIDHVIGVAFGKRKLKVLLGALRGQILNILFTDEDGTTKLTHEIESYSNGHLVAWVNVPTLSNTSDTHLAMYYGNDNLESQENPDGVRGLSQ